MWDVYVHAKYCNAILQELKVVTYKVSKPRNSPNNHYTTYRSYAGISPLSRAAETRRGLYEFDWIRKGFPTTMMLFNYHIYLDRDVEFQHITNYCLICIYVLHLQTIHCWEMQPFLTCVLLTPCHPQGLCWFKVCSTCNQIANLSHCTGLPVVASKQPSACAVSGFFSDAC